MLALAQDTVLCPCALRCHAWSPDRTRLAVAQNGKEVVVYGVPVGWPVGGTARWAVLATLQAHEQKVLALDWAPATNRLLSCAEDRTAYVWEEGPDGWAPKVAHLGPGFSRGLRCARWSPDGRKFAVGSAAGLVCVCCVDEEQDWWTGKAIKHHTSSVTAVAWNPVRGGMLATASTDKHVRLFAAHIKGIDAEGFGKFGALLAAVPAKGWVKACEWTPDGALLAFVGQDATLSVVDLAAEYAVQTVKTPLLPFTSLAAPTPTTLLAGCADCCVYAFAKGPAGWALAGRLEKTHQAAGPSSQVSQAMARFKAEAATGQPEAVDRLGSTHQNSVTELRLLKGGADWHLSSVGNDGRLAFWTPADVVPLT